MPGWDSLQAVTAVHGAFQLGGLVLLVFVAALAAFVAYQLRNGVWPEWLDVGEYQLRSRFFAIGCAGVLTLLVVTELAAYGYGLRLQSLIAAAEQVSADRIKRLTADSKSRPAADSPTRYLKENSELRQKLIEAENKLAELERAQLQKRLSAEQKRFLIEALRPFAGQKVSIASIAAMTRDCSSPRNSCPCSKLPVGTTTAKPAYPLRNGRATLWGSRWS